MLGGVNIDMSSDYELESILLIYALLDSKNPNKSYVSATIDYSLNILNRIIPINERNSAKKEYQWNSMPDNPDIKNVWACLINHDTILSKRIIEELTTETMRTNIKSLVNERLEKRLQASSCGFNDWMNGRSNKNPYNEKTENDLWKEYETAFEGSESY